MNKFSVKKNFAENRHSKMADKIDKEMAVKYKFSKCREYENDIEK